MADSKYRDWLRRILLSFHCSGVSIEHGEHHPQSQDGPGLTKQLTQWVIVRIADLLEESLSPLKVYDLRFPMSTCQDAAPGLK